MEKEVLDKEKASHGCNEPDTDSSEHTEKEAEEDTTVKNTTVKNTAVEDVAEEDKETEETEEDIQAENAEKEDIEAKNTVSPEEKKKKIKRKNFIYNTVRYIVIAIALIIFAYASYQLTLIYVDSREGDAIKKEASDMFMVDADDIESNDDVGNAAGNQPVTIENEGDGKVFVYNHKKMLSYNSEAKGYIRQDKGEYIDNPILQHSDNEYYLTHLANNTKSSLGAIYIDCNIQEGLNAKNCIIYGHAMGTRAGNLMFGSLNWYWNKTGYYKEHPTFDIWIENQRYRYYVFAVYKVSAAGDKAYTYGFNSDEEFLQYVEECKFRSRYEFKDYPKITKDSYLVTLSTCTSSDDERLVVQLVRGEKLNDKGEVME